VDSVTSGGASHRTVEHPNVFFFDPLYIVIIVATLVISGGAQLYIRSTYARWNRVPNAAVLNGAQVAEVLRERARFGNAV